jgi:hypothetical protein
VSERLIDLASAKELTGNPKRLSLLHKRRLISLDETLPNVLVVDWKQGFV